MARKIAVAIDIYGTVLTMESIGQEIEKQFPQANTEAILKTWRQYQLAYTWRLNSLGASARLRTLWLNSHHIELDTHLLLKPGRFLPFSEVTRNALTQTLTEVHGVEPTKGNLDCLMNAFRDMGTFPDVSPTLSRLASTPEVVPVVFTNGTKPMVSQSLSRSKDLAPYSNVFRDIVSVDDVRQFKPAPAVYKHLAETLGMADQMDNIWVITANPFDVNGARNIGMQAIWIDRSLTGWTDRAEPELPPTAVLHSLEDVIKTIVDHYKSRGE